MKWKRKRPLKAQIHKEIRLKKSLWRKYIREKDNSSWLKYASQRNKSLKIIRNDLLEEQNTIAQLYKSYHNKFWKYVSSKSKYTKKSSPLKIERQTG